MADVLIRQEQSRVEQSVVTRLVREGIDSVDAIEMTPAKFWQLDRLTQGVIDRHKPRHAKLVIKK